MLIILWIGEVCKERNEGIQFWKVKGFEKISILPQSLLLPPLLLSLAYILLPFFYFSYEKIRTVWTGSSYMSAAVTVTDRPSDRPNLTVPPPKRRSRTIFW